VSSAVLEGNCLEIMATLDADSIDAIVTDPPYGLSFMGKGWDHGVPGMDFWKAALRVAEPGAYLLAFGGARTFHRLTCAIEDAGFEIQDAISWLYGSGFPKHRSKLKPAWEPIILARRPAARATPLNIDACRIASAKGDGVWGTSNQTVNPDRKFNASPSGAEYRSEQNPLGRWPANVVLDEGAAAMLDEQSGTLTSGANPTRRGGPKLRTAYGEFQGQTECEPARGVDIGGASRFYYCAKASRADRDAGLYDFAKKSGGANVRGFTEDVAKGVDRNRPVHNHHPTVKPLDLMQWLCRLVTPKGGTVLDPFCGSGSTGRAAVAEGFSFIGIELDAEYAAIARARITEYAPLFAEVGS
jgi:site-specific DNA-methyltransferase (adenine-specific)